MIQPQHIAILNRLKLANHRITCSGLKPVIKGLALVSGVHPVKLPLSTIGAVRPMNPYAMEYYTALRLLDNK